jgi:uncharacterized protein YjiS (DUF1127 family)
MLSRSHAAHAVPTNWRDNARTAWHGTWRPLAQFANRALRNAVTRRELAELDDRMLADIGITRSVAVAEMDRLPWDDSPHQRPPHRGVRRSIWQRAGVLWQRHRSRQRIGELDAYMLKDIGVSFSEAEAEANKPFWRV